MSSHYSHAASAEVSTTLGKGILMGLGHCKEMQLFLLIFTCNFHGTLIVLARGIFVQYLAAVETLLEREHKRLLLLG